jgi:hypothetical protein
MDVICQDRENKLRDQVAMLEVRVAQLQQANVSLSKRAAGTADLPSYPESHARAMTTTSTADIPPRPDSRASTVYPSRSATPTSSVNGHRTNTPPQTTVWDSMHAPTATRRYSRPQVLRRAVVEKQARTPRGPSPTPSVVSVTLAKDEEGWYDVPGF